MYRTVALELQRG